MTDAKARLIGTQWLLDMTQGLIGSQGIVVVGGEVQWATTESVNKNLARHQNGLCLEH